MTLRPNMSLDELIAEMRSKPVQSSDYIEANGELSLRVALSQLKAAATQERVAWYQLAAVVAMYLTIVATLFAPWLARSP
jgi:hypothetical protein